MLLREDFPPLGTAEVDLSGRAFVEFVPLDIAYSVQVSIGFCKDPQRHPRCLDFTELPPQYLANPYERLGASLQSFDQNGKPLANNQIVRFIVDGQDTTVLLLQGITTITSQEKIDVIELQIVADKKVTAEALDASGTAILGKVNVASGSTIQHIRLEGSGLHDAKISIDGGAYLLSACIDGAALRQLREIEVTALAGGFEVERAVVTGGEGDVVTVSLAADIIDRIHLSSGFASLIDLCWSSALADARSGWRPVAGVKQPIALPARAVRPFR